MQTTRWSTAVLVAALSTAAFAADAPSLAERRRLIQLHGRDPGQSTAFLNVPKAPGRAFDAGGWVTAASLDLRDDDKQAATPDSTHTLLLGDTRLWFAGELSDSVEFYVRVRHQDFKVRTEPGTAPTDLSQQEGVKLDQAFLDVQISKKLEARVGRQFVQVGRGLTLALDLDGAGLDYTDTQWHHRIFAGRSLDRDPGLDTSLPGYDQGLARHNFVFGESRMTAENGSQWYLYAMAHQDDSRTSDPFLSLLDFSYNSHYVGFGGEGRLHPLLNYYFEVVGESGTTIQGTPNFLRVPVTAYALTSGLQYYPRWFWNPQVSYEVSMGSGDRERQSVTDTFGLGNPTATGDNNFLYYGAYDGGLALSPRLSNLVVNRLGYQVKPLPHKGDELPQLVLGAVASKYWKDVRLGAVSDTVATQPQYDVGTGLDIYMGFRPLSDLSMLFQYGRFEPGDAYPADSRDAADRVFVTATQSF